MREFIEDLNVAGIRFVYFSDRGVRQTKGTFLNGVMWMFYGSCIVLGFGKLVSDPSCLPNDLQHADDQEQVEIDTDPSSVKAS
jgi:hypothetical protein